MALRRVVWAGLPAVFLALAWGCSIGYEVDDEGFCRLAPEDAFCAARAGRAGTSGLGGTAGAPLEGTGGAPLMGAAGSGGVGGTGGSGGSCSDDSGCKTTGEGSLCVQSVCTQPLATCDKAAVVVVDEAFNGSLVGAPLGGCYYRDVDTALGAVVDGITKRLAVYATEAVSAAPIEVKAGVAFEGHGAAAGQPVTLTVTGAGGAALVTLGDGAALSGFALDGKGAKVVAVLAGKASLAGPLTVRGGVPALSVEGTASATVTGTAEAKVLFTANERGLYAAGTAGLELSGTGGESVVIEKTTKGAGVLFDKGQIDKGELKVTGALVRDNQGSDSTNGSGGVEVRESRKATVSGGTFSNNNTSLSFQGQGISATVSGGTFSNNNTSLSFQGSPGDLFDAFKDVRVTVNDFSAALPSGGGGAVICGRSLTASGTTLTLGQGGQANLFPEAATCEQLDTAVQPGSCSSGANIGFTGGTGNPFDVVCTP